MQLNNKKNKAIKKTKASLLVSVLLQILLVGVITGALWYVLNLLKSTSFLPIDKNFMLFAVFITQAIGILTCIFGLVSALYTSKDNSIIFTLPARPTEIFISRLIVFYISEFMKNLYFIIPLLVSFGVLFKFGVWYFLSVVLYTFLFPLIAVLIGAVVSLPLMYVIKFLKRYPYIKFALIAISATLVMWLVVYITKIIPRPLRLLAIYGQFTTWLKQSIITVNKFSLFYQNLVDSMMSQNVVINLVIIVSIVLGLMLLTIAITFAYFEIVSQNFEFSSGKRKKGKNKPTKSTYITFVKRELLLSVKCASINQQFLVCCFFAVCFVYHQSVFRCNQHIIAWQHFYHHNQHCNWTYIANRFKHNERNSNNKRRCRI